MATITIDLDDDLVRHVEESARREHKSVSDWIRERVRPEADRAAILAALEARALAGGYPPGWLALYGSLADDESFTAPAWRSPSTDRFGFGLGTARGLFLDTNIVVFCLHGKSAAAMHRLHAVSASDIRVPLQVHAELLVGAAKSKNPVPAKTRVLAFLAPFAVAWPDFAVEDHYVAIRTHLEALGTPISEADLWIAAAARTAGGTLVTNNTREFRRVPNLSVDDWTIP